MDILKNLLSLFFESDFGKKLKPILEILASNNFDFASLIKNLDINMLMPIFSAFNSNNENCSVEFPTEQNEIFNDIEPFACKKIVEALNQYCN